MVKQLDEKEEAYCKGFLDSGLSFRKSIARLLKKFGRILSLNTIKRINEQSKKITKIRFFL